MTIRKAIEYSSYLKKNHVLVHTIKLPKENLIESVHLATVDFLQVDGITLFDYSMVNLPSTVNRGHSSLKPMNTSLAAFSIAHFEGEGNNMETFPLALLQR